MPLTAHGEALGVLHLCTGADGGAAPLTDAVRRLAETAAEQVAMTVANLELRDSLRHQSIRDPLTGLFNRRHFQDSLDREVRRAQQSGTPLGLLLLDIDHFKKVNDTYTHEGGDRVLSEVGAFLRRHVRGNDIPCRYGGEEIAILLPRVSLEATRARAEELRCGIRELPITFQGGRLEPVTVSIGVAVLPDHGDQGAALVRAADEALYVSKKNGRDRVTVPGEALEG